MYKIIHDDDYIEEVHSHQYIVAKVYDNNDNEVSQLKLELVNDPAHDGPTIKIGISGDVKKLQILHPEKIQIV